MTTDAKIIFDMAGRIDTSLMNLLEKFTWITHTKASVKTDTIEAPTKPNGGN